MSRILGIVDILHMRCSCSMMCSIFHKIHKYCMRHNIFGTLHILGIYSMLLDSRCMFRMLGILGLLCQGLPGLILLCLLPFYTTPHISNSSLYAVPPSDRSLSLIMCIPGVRPDISMIPDLISSVVEVDSNCCLYVVSLSR